MAESPQANNDLPATPAPAADPRAGAEAALAQALEQRQAAELKKVEDGAIVDPDARPQHYRKPPATPNDEPTPSKPDLIAGASTSEPEAGTADKLIDRAVAVNIPEADARNISRETLRRMVVQLERRTDVSPRQVERAAEQAVEEDEFDLPPIESGDPDVEVLPGLKKGLDQRDEVLKSQQKKIAELEKRDQERAYQEQVREQKNAERTFGKFIADDADLHEDLGKSVGYPDDPAQMKSRGELWTYYSTAINRGKEPDEAYKIARRALYGDKLADIEGKKTSDRAEAQAKRMIRPPAGGKPKEMPFGRDRAIAELKAKLDSK